MSKVFYVVEVATEQQAADCIDRFNGQSVRLEPKHAKSK